MVVVVLAVSLGGGRLGWKGWRWKTCLTSLILSGDVVTSWSWDGATGHVTSPPRDETARRAAFPRRDGGTFY